MLRPGLAHATTIGRSMLRPYIGTTIITEHDNPMHMVGHDDELVQLNGRVMQAHR
jgi:hypothetical protein